jgi:hypothetical protein
MGIFDMAVNGGGLLTLNYEKSNLLPVQRYVQTPLQDYAITEDVVMIGLNPQVDLIDLNSNQVMQVARGSKTTDADGSHQAPVLFAQDTTPP